MNELSEEATATADATDAPRPGVPVWRVGKPDAFLAADVATAREAVLSIASESEIGAHLGARSEGVRCVTHLFESTKPGYHGWVWFASLARVSRGKHSTVNEVGMLPTEDAVLAPAWVPWSERVRPEDQEQDAKERELTAPDTTAQDDSDPDHPVEEEDNRDEDTSTRGALADDESAEPEGS